MCKTNFLPNSVNQENNLFPIAILKKVSAGNGKYRYGISKTYPSYKMMTPNPGTAFSRPVLWVSVAGMRGTARSLGPYQVFGQGLS